ncbi:MAG: hypothetical protein EH225_02650, partial [Calditrichaeota bacterium]
MTRPYFDCPLTPLYKTILILVLILLIIESGFSQSDKFSVKYPRVVLTDIGTSLEIEPNPGFYLEYPDGKVFCRIVNEKTGKVMFSDSLSIDAAHPEPLIIPGLEIKKSGKKALRVQLGKYTETVHTRALPAILSILPPLLAILLALVTRQVIVALFFGIWLGVTFLYDYNPMLGFLHTLDEYIVNALGSSERISILIFSLVLGGMVGVISRSGGTQGIVKRLSTLATSPRTGQLATWAMGVLIFFDDYANTLIVGNTMRPLSDRLRISREKLSYLVDSTAAPVANVAIISTWIGYEISLINQSFNALGVTDNAYITFLKTIPYNFYPLYALFFGFLIAFLMRDFGSMYRAEMRTRRSGAVLREGAVPISDLTETDVSGDKEIPLRWYNALIPIAVVILS